MVEVSDVHPYSTRQLLYTYCFAVLPPELYTNLLPYELHIGMLYSYTHQLPYLSQRATMLKVRVPQHHSRVSSITAVRANGPF